MLRHAALAIGQLELMLAENGAQIGRRLLEEVECKGEVLAQYAGGLRRLIPSSAGKLLTNEPLGVGAQLAAESPEVSGVGRVHRLHLVLLQGLADRLEEGLAMLFDERLEERQAQHFAFAFIDAWRQVFVHLIAKHVAMQERTPAMRLHEEFDGRFFLRFAAEDLGDDAFELAAIALVDQPATPIDHGVAAGNQAGQPGHAPLHQLARGNGLTVGAAEFGPRQQVRQHDPHIACSSGAESDPAQIQAVIGDGQAIPLFGLEQVLARHLEAFEFHAVIECMAQSIEAVRDNLELFVFGWRQVCYQNRGLAVDDDHQADRSAWYRVRDEEFFAVHFVVVAYELGCRFEGGKVRARARLGEREAGKCLTASEAGQQPALLIGRAEGANGIDGADAAVNGSQACHR